MGVKIVIIGGIAGRADGPVVPGNLHTTRIKLILFSKCTKILGVD
jgi:hypothetical protein